MVALPGRLPKTRWITVFTVVGSAVSVLAFIAAGWLGSTTMLGIQAHDGLNDQALSAQLAAETLLSTLQDAETGQRGYLLTGNPDYLQPYKTATARVAQDFAWLEGAPFADGGRIRRLEHVRELATAKLAELGRTVSLWQSGDHDGALVLVRTNQGELLMNEIRAEMEAIQAGTASQLDQSRSASRNPLVRGEIVALLTVGCLVLGAIIVVQKHAHTLIAAGFAQLSAFTQDLDEAKRQQQQTTVLLNTILDTAPGLIYAKAKDGRMLLANTATLALIGKPWPEVEGRTDREFLDDPAQGEVVMANDRRVMEQGVTEEVEEHVGTGGQQARVFLSTKTPMRSSTGQVTGLVGVSVDITERKRVEARLRDMVDELSHRVKNTLATVQSIASISLRGADPVIRDKLESRLLALASVHDVLRHANWEGASLAGLVASVLAPYGGPSQGEPSQGDPSEGDTGNRIQASGPPLQLNPRAAIAIALGLHELATNALKYGALAADLGTIALRWDIVADTRAQLRLVWSERGGDPVQPPARRGFGTRLIERSLAHDVGGEAVIQFEPAGVRCVITAPLAEVAASADIKPFPRVGRM